MCVLSVCFSTQPAICAPIGYSVNGMGMRQANLVHVHVCVCVCVCMCAHVCVHVCITASLSSWPYATGRG